MLRRATALKRICDRQRVQNARLLKIYKNARYPTVCHNIWKNIPIHIIVTNHIIDSAMHKILYTYSSF